MKLVLIQGMVMAQYTGRKQGPVVATDSWNFDVKSFVEDFRVRGFEAV